MNGASPNSGHGQPSSAARLPQADFWEAREISFPPEVLATKFGSCPNPSQSFRLIRFTPTWQPSRIP